MPKIADNIRELLEEDIYGTTYMTKLPERLEVRTRHPSITHDLTYLYYRN